MLIMCMSANSFDSANDDATPWPYDITMLNSTAQETATRYLAATAAGGGTTLTAVKANCEREEWICVSIGTCFSVPGPHTIQPHQIRLEAAAAATAAPSSDDVCVIVTDGPPFSVLCYFKWQGCFQLSRFYV